MGGKPFLIIKVSKTPFKVIDDLNIERIAVDQSPPLREARGSARERAIPTPDHPTANYFPPAPRGTTHTADFTPRPTIPRAISSQAALTTPSGPVKIKCIASDTTV